MRSASKIDPAVQADLDALDAALAGERPDLEVAIIADEARNAAAPMPSGLALRLETAIEESFAKQAKPSWREKLMMPAVGLGCAALLAGVIALGSSGGGADEESATSAGGSSVAQQEAADSAAGAGRESGGAGTALPPSAMPESGMSDTDADLLQPVTAAPAKRRVQRAAELTLTSPLAELQETSDEVVQTTDRLGGYVQNSDVFTGEDRGRATFDLRIPAERLDEALAALSKLGNVQSRTQESDDITSRFTSARSRLTDARAERQALLRALAEATTTQEIDSINQRLEIANSRIAAARSDLLGARRAANLARVSVTVVGSTGEDESGAAGSDDGWTPGQALGDAADVLSVALGVLIVALAASIPAAIVLALLALLWRAWRKRSRDLALGGSAV